ncbi:hypothetical protein LEMLEM_LOCUS21764, partial [Lemmus lemmus]
GARGRQDEEPAGNTAGKDGTLCHRAKLNTPGREMKQLWWNIQQELIPAIQDVNSYSCS